jgi:DNA-binding CsgD family transcriptional regulator
LLARALTHLGQTADRGLVARTLAASAQAHFFAGLTEEGATLSLSAVESAQHAGAESALAAALETRRIVMWGPDHLPERLMIARQIVSAASTASDGERMLDGLYWQIAALVESGDVPAARRRLAEFGVLAQRLGLLRRQAEWRRMDAMLTLLRGDAAGAQELAAEALQLAERAGDHDAGIYYAALRIETGRDDGSDRDVIRDIIADPAPWHENAARRSMLAYLSSRAGDNRKARSLIAGLAASDFDDLPRDWMWLPLMTLLGEAVVQLAAGDSARRLYLLLEPYAGQYVVNSNAVCYGSVERVLGLLARFHDPARAQAHLDRAVERNEEFGAPIWTGRSREALGLLLLDQRRPAEANAMLAAAASDFARAGNTSAEARMRARIRAHGLAPDRAPSLTARELEVLRLLAGGASNQEIAGSLVLSVRTVERHIANIYAKAGLHGRAEAAAFAIRQHLLA